MMTIYDSSRYTNIPVSMQYEAQNYIQDRTSYLHMSAKAGDMMLVTNIITGMYKGAVVQVLDGLLTEFATVDSVGGPFQEIMWDSTTSSYTTMTHYHIMLKSMLMNNHPMGTIIVFPKKNYRPSGIPTIVFREGSITTDIEDEVVVWRENDRLDILSYTRYGDASLWWAILDANPQFITEMSIKVGDTLIIPRYEKVQQYIRSGT